VLKFTANLSLLFTELPLIDRFKAAKEHGFDAVEIQFPYEMDALKLKNELDNNQLKLVIFNVAADDLLQGGEGLAAVPEKQQQFQEALATTVEYAKILKPEAINILPGCCFDEKKLTSYQNIFKENLKLALNAFSPLGIKTVFEAINTYDMPHFIIHNSNQMLDIINEIKHPDLFMQYDIYHLYKMHEDPTLFISTYADKIGHIQFADSPNRYEPGTGEIDFDALFNSIEKSNYLGWVGAEYKPLQSTEKSLAWLTSQKNKT
jgi:hydroxypyruvate isomerase